jgi:hypothetical protein
MANLAYAKDRMGDNEKIISVKSAADTLDDGYLVVAETLSTTYGESDVYVCTKPAAATDGSLAMIIGENFYEDTLGNRPDVDDPTKITYTSGDVVRAVRPHVDMRFALSDSCIDGTTVLGQYIIPTASAYTWDESATIPNDTCLVAKVEYKGTISTIGGVAVSGIIARVVVYRPEISAQTVA